MTFKNKNRKIVNLSDDIDDIIDKLEQVLWRTRPSKETSNGEPTEAEAWNLLLKAYAIKASLLTSEHTCNYWG